MATKKTSRKESKSGKKPKSPAQKAELKKAGPPKKSAPKKAVKATAAKKSAPKKAAPKKVVVKKVVAKKAAPKKVAPKKAAPKKAAPKKVVVKKVVVKKSAPKKAAPKKVAPKTVAKPAPKKPMPVAKKAQQPAKPAVKVESKVAQANAAKQAAHKFIVEIDRPTGMYNGVLLADIPKLFPKKTPYSRKEIEKLREALLQERERLVNELNSLQGASRSAMEETRDHPGYSMHLAEHATDLQTAEASLGLRTIEQERLELVDEALDRIKSNINHYGLCLACGNKIGIQRLIARPHAHLCMDCRQKYEKIRARKGL